MRSMRKGLSTVDDYIYGEAEERNHPTGSSHLRVCNKEVKLLLECGSTSAVNH